MSEELFSGRSEDEEPASPEIPIQSKLKESCSLSSVPRWCYDEGLVKKPQSKVASKSNGKGRRTVPSSGSESDADEVKESLKEIKSVLKTLSERVGKNDDRLKELQEESTRSILPPALLK